MQAKDPPPHNLIMHKGSFSAAMDRKFVDFAINNPIGRDLLHWLHDAFIPDEYFWSTLYHSFYGPRHVLTYSKKQEFRVRYTHWGQLSPVCSGYYEHGKSFALLLQFLHFHKRETHKKNIFRPMRLRCWRSQMAATTGNIIRAQIRS